MLVYNFNEITKEYIGISSAQLDPLTSMVKGEEVYLLPANSTFVKPLVEAKDNEVLVFNEKENTWDMEPDFRGTVAYDKKTGEQLVISEIGNIPDTYTLEKPFNSQTAKIEAIQSLNLTYQNARANKVKIKGILVNLEDMPSLREIFNSLDEKHNIHYFDTEAESIPLTKEELEAIIDKLYERSIQLPEKKNEYIKKIKSARSWKTLNKILEEAIVEFK